MSDRGASGARPVLGEAEVRRIAALARLELPAAAVPGFVHHFERMLEFVAQLHEVDVRDVDPDLHPARGAESLRADSARSLGEAGGPVSREAVLANAPDHEGPYFVTPKVV